MKVEFIREDLKGDRMTICFEEYTNDTHLNDYFHQVLLSYLILAVYNLLGDPG